MDQLTLTGANHPGVNKSRREWWGISFSPYQLWEATTGEAAITAPPAASLCLVIIDIGLPGRPGIEATNTIQELSPSTRW